MRVRCTDADTGVATIAGHLTCVTLCHALHQHGIGGCATALMHLRPYASMMSGEQNQGHKASVMEGLRGLWGFGLMLSGGGILLLTRAILIQLGKAKGPLLERFRTHLDVSIHYNSLRDMTLNVAMIWAGSVLLVAHFTLLSASWLLPASAMLVMAALTHWFEDDLYSAMPKPKWYRRFTRMTTPDDRRHLAHAWQKISPAMRKHYNAHDEAFHAWEELVMLTVTV